MALCRVPVPTITIEQVDGPLHSDLDVEQRNEGNAEQRRGEADRHCRKDLDVHPPRHCNPDVARAAADRSPWRTGFHQHREHSRRNQQQQQQTVTSAKSGGVSPNRSSRAAAIVPSNPNDSPQFADGDEQAIGLTHDAQAQPLFLT